jgi:hypothetical protein
MISENPKLDPIQAQAILDDMRKDAAKRRHTTPHVRIRRPWLGTLNWEHHNRKMANKRRAANKVARQTRRAQRRASRA